MYTYIVKVYIFIDIDKRKLHVCYVVNY